MPLDIEIGICQGDFVLDGDPAPPPQKRGRAPFQFSANAYCGQTAGWIKMPLGREVGLSADDILLDGDPAPSHQKGAQPTPIFGPCLYVVKFQTTGCVRIPLGIRKLVYGSKPIGPGDIVLDEQQPSIFGPFLDGSRCHLARR